LKKSQFAKDLEGGKTNFQITNISKEDTVDLQYAFRKTIASGKITYQNYDIKIPENLTIDCSGAEFDFSKFDETKIAQNITFDQITKDVHLVNTQISDLLLYGDKTSKVFY
jgi:hypothetical protein